ncbi:hypothetical protein EJV47_11445 [Hymenobacter gummosus]|uniref:Uncharacterized protein n=1 Tax=Hymenobacter gummosus TaxID=1776032 RepID=A0A431U490_9BACT|nr:hypothetical protein [Hymenobacter gummosus]RTQ50235.1 hypothetical protein EJV47_11445 [Hymenobacter gummosus]
MSLSAAPPIASKPPWHKAVLLWLCTNAGGSAVFVGLLLLLGIRDGDAAFGLFAGLVGGLIAAVVSLASVPLAGLLFFLLPRVTAYWQRQWLAGLGPTVIFLLPVVGMTDFISEPAWRLLACALPYWPAALASAMYLYRPWLFPAAAVAEEPWV